MSLPAHPELPQPPDALAVQGLSKTFAGVRVLTSVDLAIEPGEVHALLGQNGSGKSTLIKCLAGVHRADPGGQVNVAGHALPHSFAPSESARFGLAFVHQDLGLIADMTVAENLALGTGFEKTGPLIRWRSQRARAQQTLDAFGLSISPTARIRDLPVTARTLLAIARAFQAHTSPGAVPLACLILDEPTAALPDNDAELLFEAIDRVTKAGVGVGYVTHRLEEVYRIARRATILRDGRRVGTFSMAETPKRDLVTAIVGEREAQAREHSPSTIPEDRAERPVLFHATHLSGARIKDATLEVRAGEIVGIAGLAGTGRSELARLIFGSQEVTGGRRYLSGQLLKDSSPRHAIKSGIALVPEDRRRDGCVLTMSITDNTTLLTLNPNKAGLLNLRKERRRVDEAIARFDIRPADPSRHLSTLSGGNQQKVVLAKWLARHPRLLVLDEPVQGVDVGAKADIFAQLTTAAASGMAILVIDSDFDNLVELCHRVLVLHGGHIVDDLRGARLTSVALSQATFGVADDDPTIVTSAEPEEVS